MTYTDDGLNPKFRAIDEAADADLDRLAKATRSTITLPTTAPAAGTLGGLLPAQPAELESLPHGLHGVQEWIYGRMKYPSKSTAGVAALALLTHFAQGHVTVESFGGLGLGEFYMVLAPTGFGKEDLRSPITVADKAARAITIPDANLRTLKLPSLQFAAPASAQGIHALLQTNRLQTFFADEVGEWLTSTSTDPHRQAALAFFMEVYGRHHGTVAAPFAVTRATTPVENPRVIIFATSTAERVLESMTRGQAESGAYNRFVIHVAEQERIPKRYNGQVYDVPDAVVDLVNWILALPTTVLPFAPGAWAFYAEHDNTVIEPLRFSDNTLAARLSEQAIKKAALIALSDRRTAITKDDLATAYAIRLGMYRRAASLVGTEGAISGQHVTTKAVDQLTAAFARHPALRRCWLQNHSRAYKPLTAGERNVVINALIADGIAKTDPGKRGWLFAVDV